MRRWGVRLLVVVAILAIVYGIVKESREPHLWLMIDDVIHPKPMPQTLTLSDRLMGRLYEDTRPHVGKVARLQKGLALVVDGEAVIEEGFGFGLPLVEVGGQAYLSRTASVDKRSDGGLVKRYQMDTVDTPSGFLRQKYVPVSPIGTVMVTYTVNDGAMEIEVDLDGLQAGWERVFLMNEQGASGFVRYSEPGREVMGDALGIWQPARGRLGCLSTADRSLQFCVETEEETARYFGRERYRQYYWIGSYALSWAGIDLEVEPPLTHLRYRIPITHAPPD